MGGGGWGGGIVGPPANRPAISLAAELHAHVWMGRRRGWRGAQARGSRTAGRQDGMSGATTASQRHLLGEHSHPHTRWPAGHTGVAVTSAHLRAVPIPSPISSGPSQVRLRVWWETGSLLRLHSATLRSGGYHLQAKLVGSGGCAPLSAEISDHIFSTGLEFLTRRRKHCFFCGSSGTLWYYPWPSEGSSGRNLGKLARQGIGDHSPILRAAVYITTPTGVQE